MGDRVSEADFLRFVVDVAQRGGWLVHHELPAQRASGRWATWNVGPAGFPDLVLLRPASKYRPGQLIVAELKVGRNKPTKAQEKYLQAFRDAGVETYLWKWPDDREGILRRLAP